MTDIVPGTQELLERFYKGPPPHTCRSIVVLDDGEPIGVGGFYADRDRFVLFADFTQRLIGMPKTLLQAGKQLVAGVKAARAPLEGAGVFIPVHARADSEFESSGRFLEHLGFVHLVGDVYGLVGED